MKTQMKFQKILSLITLIVAALTLVYAFSFMTSLSALSGYTSVQNQGPELFEGVDDAYFTAHDFNDMLVVFGIIFVVIAVTLYITASNRRRNYYITNYISVIATAAIALVCAIVGIIVVSICVSKYFAMDTDKYYELAHKTWTHILTYETTVSDTNPDPEWWVRAYTYYSDPTAFFVIGYVCYVLDIAIAGATVFNLIWKIKLMKGEKALLENGLVKEVA